MLKISIIIGIIAISLLLILALFILWASSSVISKSEYQTGKIIQLKTPMKLDVSAESFSVLTLNLGFATGMKQSQFYTLTSNDIHQNLTTVADYLSQNAIDIAAFQEIDFNSNRSHNINQAETIAQNAGYPYMAIAYTWNQKKVPYPSKWNSKRQFGKTLAGQAVLSKYPIRSQRVIRFSKPASNSPLYNLFYLDRIAQIVDIELPNKTLIHVVNIHLEAFDSHHRQRQMEHLISQIPTANTLLLGDFNALPPNIPQKSGYPDEPNTVYNDQVIKTALDVFQTEAFNPIESVMTYPSDLPNRRLDYIFYSPEFNARESRVVDFSVPPSDHNAIQTRLYTQ